MTILYIILLFFACGILVKSADLAIRNLTKIAIALKWSEFIASFILVAVATSLPEIFVALISAIHKMPILSLGNIIGANMINLTLILGLTAIIGGGLRFKEVTIKRNVFSALILSLYPMLLALDKTISRIDGIAILVAFLFYVLLMFYQEKQLTKIDNENYRKDLIKAFFLFIVGIILLIGSAEIITKSAQILAINLKLPLILIGLLIVSLGTILPELTFNLRSTLKGHKEMLLGNSLGTIVTNSCFALGLAAIICPIHIIYFNQFLIMFIFLLSANIFLSIFLYLKKDLSVSEGIGLIIFYIFFVTIQILFKF